MKQRIHITGVRNEPPDLDQFVAALAAFVMAQVEAEYEAEAKQTDTEPTAGDD